MRRDHRHARVIALAAIAVLIIVFLWPREPSYQGKGLGRWLAELEDDASARSAQDQAVEAVRVIGTNALPRLTEMLCAQDSLLRRVLLQLGARSLVARLQIQSSRRLQNRGLLGYQALGNAATVYLPVLIRLMDDPRSPPQAKAYVALALGHMGREARTAIPALARAALDKDQELRLNSILALANIQQNTDRGDSHRPF
jgi:hypothetical protein